MLGAFFFNFSSNFDADSSWVITAYSGLYIKHCSAKVSTFGLAVNAAIAPLSVFARKNYFYPDLPKGYQISQYELPIVEHGELFIRTDDGTEKRIGITRAHLEEDAGKSIHKGFGKSSGIDLNRAGTPLLEIVSEPDLRSAKEAVAYMRKIHSIVRYLEISDGNMQEGSFRCDANVSVRVRGEKNSVHGLSSKISIPFVL